MSDGKIKVAIIGTGGWGRQHARVFSERMDVDLCAIAGRNRERVEGRAAEYHARAYLDVDRMLEVEKPDLVSICLPNMHHFETTLRVIEQGVPILCEKPLTFELDEAGTLIEAAERRNLFFAINFNHRYARTVQMAKMAIDNGDLGDIVFASWRFGGEGGQEHPYANLIETQCHGFDQIEYLCGPIRSISAQMTDMTGKGMSTMVLAMALASGGVASLVGSYDSSYAYQRTHRLEINGAKGRIEIDDTVASYSFQRAGSETAEVWRAGYFNDADRDFHRTFDKHVDVLLAHLGQGLPPPVHARAGLRALELAWAGVRSFENGNRMDV